MTDTELREKILNCFGDEQVEDGGYFALYDGKWVDITNEVHSLMQLVTQYGDTREREGREAELVTTLGNSASSGLYATYYERRIAELKEEPGDEQTNDQL